mgnify:CR=1 FL=1
MRQVYISGASRLLFCVTSWLNEGLDDVTVMAALWPINMLVICIDSTDFCSPLLKAQTLSILAVCYTMRGKEIGMSEIAKCCAAAQKTQAMAKLWTVQKLVAQLSSQPTQPRCIFPTQQCCTCFCSPHQWYAVDLDKHNVPQNRDAEQCTISPASFPPSKKKAAPLPSVKQLRPDAMRAKQALSNPPE